MLSADDISFFAVLMQAHSLAAASRILNVSPPAVTQRLKALEDRLGVRLVDRSARRISLTDEGEFLLERSTGIVAQIDELKEDFHERHGLVAGHLRIAAPYGFGRRYIAPAITKFRAEHPDVRATLDLSDSPISLRPNPWDIILHIGELRSLPFQMVTLAPNRRLLCAAPDYLAKHGTPTRPLDLLAHQCLILLENDEDVTLWRFSTNPKMVEKVRLAAPVSSNSGDVIHDWALSGLGIMLRSEWDVAEDLRTGRLIHLMPNWAAPDAPVIALLGPKNHRAARVQHFVECLKSILQPAPWRHS